MSAPRAGAAAGRGRETAARRPVAPALAWHSPLSAVRGIGPARASQLAQAGMATVGDLLCYLPARWEDRRSLSTVSTLPAAGAVTVEGEISELRRLFTRRRGMSVLRGRLVDASGELPVVWFNRPYLLTQVRAGTRYRLHGVLRASGAGRELVSPTVEEVTADEAGVHAGRVVPVYPALGELGPATLRRLFAQLLAQVDLDAVAEPLPAGLRGRHGLPSLGEALRRLHAPGDELAAAGHTVADLDARRTPAHGRLIYGELLGLQVELQLVRQAQRRQPKSHRYRVDDELRAVARQILPFKLTAAQKRVVREIADDLRRPEPMLRLLQGDVGSGKTLVAAMAILLALENGLQAAFMAPTELLAEQQAQSLRRLFGARYRIALLSGSRLTGADGAEVRTALARKPADGGIHLAVGTHALIQESVRFARLGLAVIDEQHRFGVAQRRALEAKGDRPDLLVMTATPIPRSLALVVYGDLDLSVIDELPPGRSPITTEVVSRRARARAYAALREAVAAGGQAYLVVPRIDAEAEGQEPGPVSLASLTDELATLLGGASWQVVHGRQTLVERDAAMRRFAAGEVDVLVATTIVEVGVDVANASVMLIESAERFGLAQLHQLRGRVGRGSRASRCLAILGDASVEARERLGLFANHTDGFAIADADLALRGPGELLGARQSGAPLLAMARLPTDVAWLERARQDARELIADPLLADIRRAAESRVAARLTALGGG